MTKKFSLTPDPYFDLTVSLPRAGAEPVAVRLTFKHRTLTQLGKLMDETKGRGDAEILLDVLHAWELDDKLDKRNVTRLVDSYPAAAREIWSAYFGALMGVR